MEQHTSKFPKTKPLVPCEMRRRRQLEEDFIDAAFVSNFDKVKYCVTNGVDVNVIGTAHMVWHNGTTALHLLAEKGDLTIGDYVLSHPKTQTDVTNLYGFTPLVLACMTNQRKFARLLLQKGADPSYPDRCDKTPLHYCAQTPSSEIAFDLLQFKANVNATDSFDNTPLSLCLLGPDANLHMARQLIKCGVDLDLENSKMVPLIIAVCMKCRNMRDINSVTLLLNAGVDVDFQDPNGYTCLHVTAITNYLPLAKALVQHGADVRMTDTRFRTPLDVAKAHQNQRVAQYLMEQLAKYSQDNREKSGLKDHK